MTSSSVTGSTTHPGNGPARDPGDERRPDLQRWDWTTMKSFAYGSNLCRGWLLNRVPSATYEVVAQLPEHQLRFHKRSKDGSGKADAHYTGDKNDNVWGLVVNVPDSERGALDRAEGLNHGYEERKVTVHDEEGNSYQVSAYVAAASHIDASLRPFDWYLRLISEGATSQGLPSAYVATLTTELSVADHDTERIRNAEVRCS